MLASFDEALFEYMAYKFTWIASNVDNDEITPMKAPKLFKAKSAGMNALLFGSYSASKVFDGFVKIPITEKRERLGIETNQGDAFFVIAQDTTTVYRLKTIVHTEDI